MSIATIKKMFLFLYCFTTINAADPEIKAEGLESALGMAYRLEARQKPAVMYEPLEKGKFLGKKIIDLKPDIEGTDVEHTEFEKIFLNPKEILLLDPEKKAILTAPRITQVLRKYKLTLIDISYYYAAEGSPLLQSDKKPDLKDYYRAVTFVKLYPEDNLATLYSIVFEKTPDTTERGDPVGYLQAEIRNPQSTNPSYWKSHQETKATNPRKILEKTKKIFSISEEPITVPYLKELHADLKALFSAF